MKIFKVKIDNNPGSWKQGDDPSLLVIANSSEEAIEKVKAGWNERYDYKNSTLICSSKEGGFAYNSYISNKTVFSCCEIVFDEYDIFIGTKDIRKKKLENINQSNEL